MSPHRTAAGGQALSVALVGNAAEIEPAWAKRGEPFDVVTDQTSAHDALAGYVPAEIALEDALALRESQPDVYIQHSMRSMADQVRAMLAFQRAGAVVFDYGNNLRAMAKEAGVEDAFDYPGFVPAFIRPLFCEGKGPFRWVALSGDPDDILATDRTVLELFPDDAHLARWMNGRHENSKGQRQWGCLKEAAPDHGSHDRRFLAHRRAGEQRSNLHVLRGRAQ